MGSLSFVTQPRIQVDSVPHTTVRFSGSSSYSLLAGLCLRQRTLLPNNKRVDNNVQKVHWNTYENSHSRQDNGHNC